MHTTLWFSGKHLKTIRHNVCKHLPITHHHNIYAAWCALEQFFKRITFWIPIRALYHWIYTIPFRNHKILTHLHLFNRFPGRNFRPGVLNTQGACEAGRCSLDMRLSASECASVSSCTKQCSKCRPLNWGSTLCYASGVAQESDCQTAGGKWDVTHGKCVFDNFRTQDSCLGAGNGTYTYEACEQQTDIEQCASMTGMSAFAQARLQCYANRWDQCETQAECEASGDCDDWYAHSKGRSAGYYSNILSLFSLQGFPKLARYELLV